MRCMRLVLEDPSGVSRSVSSAFSCSVGAVCWALSKRPSFSAVAERGLRIPRGLLASFGGLETWATCLVRRISCKSAIHERAAAGSDLLYHASDPFLVARSCRTSRRYPGPEIAILQRA